MPLFQGGAWTNPVPPSAHGRHGGATKVVPSRPTQQPVGAVRTPKAEEAVDFFANLSAWNGGPLPSIVNGDTLDFGTPTTTYSNHQVFSNTYYYWRDSGMFFQVPQVAQGTGTGTVQTYFGIQIDGSNSAQWDIRMSSGVITIYAKHTIATVETTIASATYDAAAHLWLRIRESQGTLYFETSPNTRVWTAFASEADVFPFDNPCAIFGGSGYFGTITPTQSGRIRMLNVAPNLLRWQEATFEGGVEHWDLSSTGGVASMGADTAQSRVGASSLGVTVTGGADAYVSSIGQHSGLLGAPVAPNTEYTLFYSMLHDSAMQAVSTAIWVQAVWFDSGGASISSPNNNWTNPYAAVGTAWVDSSFYLGYSPPNAAYVQLIFAHGGNVSLPANGKWWIDRVGIAAGNRAPSYWTAPTAPTGPYVCKIFSSYYTSGGTGETTTGTYPIYSGDLLVMFVVDQSGSAHLNYTPSNSGTNLTWTRRVDEYVASSCPIQIWTAPASATQTPQTFTVTSTGTQSFEWGMLRVTGHNEATFGGNTSASTVVDTTQPYTISTVTQAANSTVITIWGDWNGNDGTARALIPSTSTELDYQLNATHLTAGAEWTTVPTASTVTTGVTGFGATSPVFTLASIEIRKLASSAYTQTLTGALSFTASYIKASKKALAASLSFTGSQVKRPTKGLAAALSYVGTRNMRYVDGGFTAALSFVGAVALGKSFVRALTGALSFVGSLAASKVLVRSLSGGLSFTGANTKQAGKTVAGALSFAGARTMRYLDGGFTAGLSFAGTRTMRYLDGGFTAALSFTGSFTKRLNRALNGGLSYVGATAAKQALTRALTASLSFTGAQSKRVSRSLSGALSFTGTTARAANRALAAALSFTGSVATSLISGSNAYTQSLSGALTFTGSQARSAQKALAGTLSFAGSQSKQARKAVSAALSFVGTRAQITAKNLGAGLSYVGSRAASVAKNLNGSASFTGAIAAGKQFIRALSATLSYTGTQARRISHGLVAALSYAGSMSIKQTLVRTVSAALSFTGSQTKKTARALTGSLVFTGSVASGKAFIRALTGALSFAGSQAKLAGKSANGALGFTGAQVRRVGKGLSGVASFVGNFSSLLNGGGAAYTKSLAASLTFTGTFAKGTARSISGALSFIGSIVRSRAVSLTAALSFVGSASKRTARGVSGALGFTGTAVVRQTLVRALSGALTFTGATTKRLSRSIGGGLNFTGAFTRTKAVIFSAVLGFTGAVTKRSSRPISAVLSYAGVFNRSFPYKFVAALTFTGATVKQARRQMSASLTSSGAMAAGRLFARAFTASIGFTGAIARRTGKSVASVLSFIPGFNYIAHVLNPAPEITHPDLVVTSLSGSAAVTTLVGSVDGTDYAGSLVLASTGTSVLVTSASGDIQ